MLKTMTGSTKSMNFRNADVQGVSVRKRDDMSEEAAVAYEDGSHIENKASGKRPPKRVESGVYVIDVYIKDLIGTKVSFF